MVGGLIGAAIEMYGLRRVHQNGHIAERLFTFELGLEIANDFATFFRRHPRIAHVFFNGARAEQAFRRHALPGLGAAGLRFARLPSTSPAHAARSLPQKRAAWRAGLGGGRVIL